MPTVFFGPFVGEFGWELVRWQWWVRRMCLEDFRDYRKIAASNPGRAAFYPYVDEFWALPESFLQLGVTPWGYITAGWRNGRPGHYIEHHALIGVPEAWLEGPEVLRLLAKAIRKVFPPRRVTETPLKTPDVEPHALAMLAEFKKRLPDDTLFLVPWQMNDYEGGALRFGVEVAVQSRGLSDFRTYEIPFSAQRLELLRPTLKDEEAFRSLFPGDRPLIGVFPRSIAVRRSDRNWAEDKYRQLIRRLQEMYPESRVAIFGEPGGAYFAGAPPAGCISLIDVPQAMRLGLQLAALQRCIFALGGASGGLSMAMAAGCSIIWWSYESSADMVHRVNPLGTPMLFYPKMHPTVDEVMNVVKSAYWMIQHGYWKVER